MIMAIHAYTQSHTHNNYLYPPINDGSNSLLLIHIHTHNNYYYPPTMMTVIDRKTETIGITARTMKIMGISLSPKNGLYLHTHRTDK